MEQSNRRKALSFDAFYFEKKEKNGAHFSMADTFSHIAEINLWGSPDSQSGVGSTQAETEPLKAMLSKLLKTLNIRSMIDAPCGDFGWLSTLDLSGIHYLGVDILAETIGGLERHYQGKNNLRFQTLDITNTTLPKADIILCRDCLCHFSFADIAAAIQRFKDSGSTYLLTTTFPKTNSNDDIVTGDWQALNCQIAPLCFPEPITLLTEGCQQNDGLYADKSLALWSLDQL